MDISVWKIVGGVTAVAALLLAPLAGDVSAKNRRNKKSPQVERQQEAEAEAAAQQAAAAAQIAPANFEQPVLQPPPAPGNSVPQAPTQAPTQGAPVVSNEPSPIFYDGEYGGGEYCDDGSGMTFSQRCRCQSERFRCWKLNHCPWCCCCRGCRGNGGRNNGNGNAWQRLTNRWNFEQTSILPADVNYFDTRDLQVHSTQTEGVPMSVPLAPVVRYAYNDGWGVPASRITTVGSTYNRWYPQEFHAFAQKNRSAPLGPDGRPLAGPGPVPPAIYAPTDTTQHGYYYKHVPQWQPAQRTRWSNIPNTAGVQAPLNPTANLTPYPLQQPVTGAAPGAMPATTPIAPRQATP